MSSLVRLLKRMGWAPVDYDMSREDVCSFSFAGHGTSRCGSVGDL